MKLKCPSPLRRFNFSVGVSMPLSVVKSSAVIITSKNEDRRLYPGMTANATIETGVREDVLHFDIAPRRASSSAAVRHAGDTAAVYRGPTLQALPISTAHAHGDPHWFELATPDPAAAAAFHGGDPGEAATGQLRASRTAGCLRVVWADPGEPDERFGFAQAFHLHDAGDLRVAVGGVDGA